MSNPQTPLELMKQLDRELQSDPARTAGIEAIFAFVVGGAAGGTWWIEAHDGSGRAHAGLPERPTLTVYLEDDIFLRLGIGEINGAEAFFNGLLSVEGDQSRAALLDQVFGL